MARNSILRTQPHQTPPTRPNWALKRQDGTRARRSAKARDKVLQKVLETGTTSQSQGRRSRPGTDLRHESADLLFNTSSPLEFVPLQDSRIQAQDSIESLAGGNGSRRDGDSSHRVMGVAVLRATVTVGYTACLSANERPLLMSPRRVDVCLTVSHRSRRARRLARHARLRPREQLGSCLRHLVLCDEG